MNSILNFKFTWQFQKINYGKNYFLLSNPNRLQNYFWGENRWTKSIICKRGQNESFKNISQKDFLYETDWMIQSSLFLCPNYCANFWELAPELIAIWDNAESKLVSLWKVYICCLRYNEHMNVVLRIWISVYLFAIKIII